MVRIGIIICDRYKMCDGGKCFRSVREHEGAFKQYKGQKIDIVGYSTCGGCPGSNIEYVATGMKNYGAEVIHFATGFLAGYPPCSYVDEFKDFIKKIVDVEVVVGTHPMPTNYISAHNKLNDIPKEYGTYWSYLVDPKESKKYDSTLVEYSKELQNELQ